MDMSKSGINCGSANTGVCAYYKIDVMIGEPSASLCDKCPPLG